MNMIIANKTHTK